MSRDKTKTKTLVQIMSGAKKQPGFSAMEARELLKQQAAEGKLNYKEESPTFVKSQAQHRFLQRVMSGNEQIENLSKAQARELLKGVDPGALPERIHPKKEKK